MKTRANIGDIVRVIGYGIRMFRIDAINYEYYRDSEEEYSGIYYDITDINTQEWLTADDADVTIVQRKGKVGKPLEIPGIETDDQEEEEPTMDELLRELSDALALREMFGDDEEPGDGKYRKLVDEIKAKLKQQSEVR